MGKGIYKTLLFHVLLLSVNITVVSLFYVVACVVFHSFSLPCNILFYIYYSLFLLSVRVDRWTFSFGAVVETRPVWSFSYMSGWTFIALCGMEFLGHMVYVCSILLAAVEEFCKMCVTTYDRRWVVLRLRNIQSLFEFVPLWCKLPSPLKCSVSSSTSYRSLIE